MNNLDKPAETETPASDDDSGDKLRVNVLNESILRQGQDIVDIENVEFLSQMSANSQTFSTDANNLVSEAKSEKDLESLPAFSEQVPQTSASERLISSAIRNEYIYGILGLILGLAAIIAGSILALNGVAGSVSWTARLLALESEVNDAAPGVVLFIVGLFMIWATKPMIKLKDLKER